MKYPVKGMDPVIRALVAAQQAHPGQRVGQLIVNAVSTGERLNIDNLVFYITDADLEDALYRYAFKVRE